MLMASAPEQNAGTARDTVFAAAMRVDPIILWSTFLLATGFMAAGKMEKGKAWTAALVLWVAGFLPVLYGAMKAG